MKKILLMMQAVLCLGLASCGNGRTKEEQKAYTDSLFHVLSCSPTIVAGPYTLEDQLEACDLLIREYPDKEEQFEGMKATIQKRIEERDAEALY